MPFVREAANGRFMVLDFAVGDDGLNIVVDRLRRPDVVRVDFRDAIKRPDGVQELRGNRHAVRNEARGQVRSGVPDEAVRPWPGDVHGVADRRGRTFEPRRPHGEVRAARLVRGGKFDAVGLADIARERDIHVHKPVPRIPLPRSDGRDGRTGIVQIGQPRRRGNHGGEEDEEDGREAFHGEADSCTPVVLRGRSGRKRKASPLILRRGSGNAHGRNSGKARSRRSLAN